MHPGGTIVPAATTLNEIVVNGVSPAARNLAYANSKVVVEIRLEDIPGINQGTLSFDPAKLTYKAQLEKQGIQAGIVFTDYLERRELECFYASATALLFPLLYEGFGFPVLEALGSRCPVICSNAASIPEVAGDAAIMLNAEDRKGFMEEMIKLAQEGPHGSRRMQLIQKGQAQAQKFTWEESAERTVNVWRRQLGLV